MITYQSGFVRAAGKRASNLVLAGAIVKRSLVQLIYAEYLWVMFPVSRFAKGVFATDVARS